MKIECFHVCSSSTNMYKKDDGEDTWIYIVFQDIQDVQFSHHGAPLDNTKQETTNDNRVVDWIKIRKFKMIFQ